MRAVSQARVSHRTATTYPPPQERGRARDSDATRRPARDSLERALTYDARVRVVHLDGSGIGSKETFLDAVSAALTFPDYFGHNWDALDECLRDIEEPTTVEWTDSANLAARDPGAYEMALRCFSDSPVGLLLL
jgi:RNAse (barnase) inhibitor barstar